MPLATDAWAFGWDALVAISTLALAVTTAIVAGFTFRVASKTSELAAATQADVAAQFRPVVAPARIRSASEPVWVYEGPNGSRGCGLTNVGKGPALDVAVVARGSDQRPDLEPSVLAVHCEGERVVLQPGTPNADGGFTICVRYASVAGERYESQITFTRRSAAVYFGRLDQVIKL